VHSWSGTRNGRAGTCICILNKYIDGVRGATFDYLSAFANVQFEVVANCYESIPVFAIFAAIVASLSRHPPPQCSAILPFVVVKLLGHA
jgi:hypothetical protein